MRGNSSDTLSWPRPAYWRAGAIRPFAVGRKNWLFSGSPRGAKASAAIYSLIDTTKANGLEPYAYLRFLFERLPYTKSSDELRALLPQNLIPPQLILPA